MADPAHLRQAADALLVPMHRLGAAVLPDPNADASTSVWQGPAADAFRRDLATQRGLLGPARDELVRIRDELLRRADQIEIEQRQAAEAAAQAAAAGLPAPLPPPEPYLMRAGRPF